MENTDTDRDGVISFEEYLHSFNTPASSESKDLKK